MRKSSSFPSSRRSQVAKAPESQFSSLHNIRSRRAPPEHTCHFRPSTSFLGNYGTCFKWTSLALRHRRYGTPCSKKRIFFCDSMKRNCLPILVESRRDVFKCITELSN